MTSTEDDSLGSLAIKLGVEEGIFEQKYLEEKKDIGVRVSPKFLRWAKEHQKIVDSIAERLPDAPVLENMDLIWSKMVMIYKPEMGDIRAALIGEMLTTLMECHMRNVKA